MSRGARCRHFSAGRPLPAPAKLVSPLPLPLDALPLHARARTWSCCTCGFAGRAFFTVTLPVSGRPCAPAIRKLGKPS